MTTLNDASLQGSISTRMLIDNTQIVDLTKLVCLRGITSSSHEYATLKREGTSAGYQPPAGYRFVCVAIKMVVYAGSSTATAAIASTTSDVGDNSTSAPTGWNALIFHNAIPATAITMVTHIQSFE